MAKQPNLEQDFVQDAQHDSIWMTQIRCSMFGHVFRIIEETPRENSLDLLLLVQQLRNTKGLLLFKFPW